MTASRPPRVGPAALAWALCGVTLAVALGGLVLAIADPNTAGPAHASPSGPTVHDTPAGDYVPYAALTAIVFSTFAVVSAVVAARRPRNPVGWLIGAGSFLWALAVLANSVYWHIAFGRPDPPAAADYVAWLGNWAFLPAFLLLLGLVPLLFPTGAPPGPGWRKVGWIAAVARRRGGGGHRPRARAHGQRRLRLDRQPVRHWRPRPRHGGRCVVRPGGRRGFGRDRVTRRPLPPRARNRAAPAEMGGGRCLPAGPVHRRR